MADQIEVSKGPRQEYGLAERFMEPFSRMRSGVDHLLDEFPARWSAFQFAGAPAVEMTEADDHYTVSVEIPGIPPEEVELQVDRDMLILKGEKKEEREEKERDYVISERSYGAFERRLSIPADALIDEIEAQSANGVLKVTIPRSQEAETQRRKIPIHCSKPE